ncbi:hypothetical protein VP01_669g1 [Puccinia sorghi]|uniref:Uncharacterized protein n=1 Tax=Puccinia sorghi TaxID=27349 RepID=A0A0L6UEV5_9BASI|nr:hypothetical protein VP01_669g1 [Puccinia sorghi]
MSYLYIPKFQLFSNSTELITTFLLIPHSFIMSIHIPNFVSSVHAAHYLLLNLVCISFLLFFGYLYVLLYFLVTNSCLGYVFSFFFLVKSLLHHACGLVISGFSNHHHHHQPQNNEPAEKAAKNEKLSFAFLGDCVCVCHVTLQGFVCAVLMHMYVLGQLMYSLDLYTGLHRWTVVVWTRLSLGRELQLDLTRQSHWTQASPLGWLICRLHIWKFVATPPLSIYILIINILNPPSTPKKKKKKKKKDCIGTRRKNERVSTRGDTIQKATCKFLCKLQGANVLAPNLTSLLQTTHALQLQVCFLTPLYTHTHTQPNKKNGLIQTAKALTVVVFLNFENLNHETLFEGRNLSLNSTPGHLGSQPLKPLRLCHLNPSACDRCFPVFSSLTLKSPCPLAENPLLDQRANRCLRKNMLRLDDSIASGIWPEICSDLMISLLLGYGQNE